MIILRGRTIEEFSNEDLVELHAQVEAELPQEIGALTMAHRGQLLELELIEDELERREHP
jgi:hypothetical protein